MMNTNTETKVEGHFKIGLLCNKMSDDQFSRSLSVVIITFNEERNIQRCIESVQSIADEILVLDSFSTDNTLALCRQYNVRCYQHAWLGYSESKNYANSLARYDWILSLDADECLSKELQESIAKAKTNGIQILGQFNRLTNYCGSWIRHSGWYPDTKIRLFDRRTCYWQGALHEKIVYPPREIPIHLKGDCLHYSFPNVQSHYTKIDSYSRIAAQNYFAAHKRFWFPMKYLSAAFKFFRTYILKLGFLDGKAGLNIATLSALANYKKYAILESLYRHPNQHE